MTLKQTLASLNPFRSINAEIDRAKKNIVQNAQAIRSGTNIINRKQESANRELRLVAEMHDLMRRK